jgi:hypothetical protein
MKQIIKDVLDDISNSQINLASAAARNVVSGLISAALKTKGSYKEYTKYELDEQEARKDWVCSICGENTFEVDYDYLGSGTNHLGCELKSQEDIDEQAYAQGRGSSFGGDTGTDADYRLPASEKIDGAYTPDEYEGWERAVKETETLVDKSVEDFERNKLSEEIIDDKEKDYIYESPDGGETIYRREFGSDEREEIKIEKVKK